MNSLTLEIECPTTVCARCEVEAPMLPTAIRISDQPSPPGFFITQNSGVKSRLWQVLQTQRPDGWTPGPAGIKNMHSGLCPDCTKDLHEAVGGFLGDNALAEWLAAENAARKSPQPQPVPVAALEAPDSMRYAPLPLPAPVTQAIPAMVQKGPHRTMVQPTATIAKPPMLSVTPSAPPTSQAKVTGGAIIMKPSHVSTSIIPAAPHQRVQVHATERKAAPPAAVSAIPARAVVLSAIASKSNTIEQPKAIFTPPGATTGKAVVAELPTIQESPKTEPMQTPAPQVVRRVPSRA